jgi:hypothetical protein
LVEIYCSHAASILSILDSDNSNALRCTDAGLRHGGTDAVLGIYPTTSVPEGSQIN